MMTKHANRIERVAIVGAGGQVGRHITEELLTGQHTVTAITRIGSKSQLPSGVKIAQVDYDDEESLVNALKGQQFLLISLAITSPLDTHQKLVTAAAKAGVSWIMPNSYGPDITNKKLAADNFIGHDVLSWIETVEKAGVSWVTMVCSYWYEFSLAISPHMYGFDILNKKVTFFDQGKTRINASTWQQCGRAVAKLLSLKELPEDENDTSPTISQWRNKPLFISSFLVSQRDMLDSMNRVMGTTDKDWQIEYEPSDVRYRRGIEIMQGRDRGDRLGIGIAMYARIFYPNGDGDYETKHGLANDALGLPKEDFDDVTRRAVAMVESGWRRRFEP